MTTISCLKLIISDSEIMERIRIALPKIDHVILFLFIHNKKDYRLKDSRREKIKGNTFETNGIL